MTHGQEKQRIRLEHDKISQDSLPPPVQSEWEVDDGAVPPPIAIASQGQRAEIAGTLHPKPHTRTISTERGGLPITQAKLLQLVGKCRNREFALAIKALDFDTRPTPTQMAAEVMPIAYVRHSVLGPLNERETRYDALGTSTLRDGVTPMLYEQKGLSTRIFNLQGDASDVERASMSDGGIYLVPRAFLPHGTSKTAATIRDIMQNKTGIFIAERTDTPYECLDQLRVALLEDFANDDGTLRNTLPKLRAFLRTDMGPEVAEMMLRRIQRLLSSQDTKGKITVSPNAAIAFHMELLPMFKNIPSNVEKIFTFIIRLSGGETVGLIQVAKILTDMDMTHYLPYLIDYVAENPDILDDMKLAALEKMCNLPSDKKVQRALRQYIEILHDNTQVDKEEEGFIQEEADLVLFSNSNPELSLLYYLTYLARTKGSPADIMNGVGKDAHARLQALQDIDRSELQIRVHELEVQLSQARESRPIDRDEIQRIGNEKKQAQKKLNEYKEDLEKTTAPLIETIVDLTYKILQASPHDLLKSISRDIIDGYVRGKKECAQFDGDINALSQKLTHIIPTCDALDQGLFSQMEESEIVGRVAKQIVDTYKNRSKGTFSLDTLKNALSHIPHIEIVERKMPQCEREIQTLLESGSTNTGRLIYFALIRLVNNKKATTQKNMPLDASEGMVMISRYVEWRLRELSDQDARQEVRKSLCNKAYIKLQEALHAENSGETPRLILDPNIAYLIAQWYDELTPNSDRMQEIVRTTMPHAKNEIPQKYRILS